MSEELKDSGQWSSENIPESWNWTKFDEIFEDVTNSKKKLKQQSYLEAGTYPVIDQGQDVVGGYYDDDSLVYDGSLPVIIFGDHSRCVKFVETKFIQGADGVKALKPTSATVESFAYWALSTIQLPDKGYSRHFKFLKASKFPLAPLNEQRRIVAKIEALKARSQQVKEAIAAIPPLLDQFRQSVLAAAFRGDLTADWREKNPDVEPAPVLLERIRAERRRCWEEAELEKMKASGKIPIDDKWKAKYSETSPINQELFPKLPEKWYWARVEELVSDIPRSIQSGPFGSNLLHSEFQDTGVLAIGIDNVLDGQFTLGREHRISYEKYKELEKYTARPLDVLITVMATVGRCCVVPSDIETAIITKHVYRLSPECELIAPHFLMNALRGSEEALRQMYGKIRGQTRPGINGQILRNLAIPVPPRLEQEQILLTINTQFASVERVFGMLNELGDAALLLDQSILAKAFRGELVPQDPNDEPASVLLERIRSERAKREAEAKAAKKSTGKTTKRRSRKIQQQDSEPNQLELPGLE